MSDLDDLLARLGDRVEDVTRQHGDFASAHEGYAVLLEEVEELFAEVRKKNHLRSSMALHNEAMDVAVVAVRFALMFEGR